MAKRQSKKSQPKKPETYAEFLEAAWAQFRTHQLGYTVGPVNYLFEVGEEVRYGAHEECRIEDSFMDGRLLHVSVHDRGTTYGTSWDNNRRLPKLVWWIDVEPLRVEEETSFGRERIRTNYMQQHLSSLLHTVYYRGIIDSPDYQRGYVWTLGDKQRLIRSLFNRADIGKFIFLEHPCPEHRLEVIDGKQRINAICEFWEGRFEFEGKTWFQLSWKDKRSLEDNMVQVAQLDAEHVKRSDVLWLFLSLNRGGVPQTDEHIAHAQALYDAAVAEELNNA